MVLRELFTREDIFFLRGDDGRKISGIAADSRKVRPGMIFFCMKGWKADGNRFAPEAVKNGAVALVTEDPEGVEEILGKETTWNEAPRERTSIGNNENAMAEGVTLIGVRDVRKTFARACHVFYGKPSEKLITIGVTGTKGKTTCTYLIRSILENAGKRVGLIGTNEIIIGRTHLAAENTTPDALTLQETLRRMVDAGSDCVVMEVSSQAYKLHRTEGIFFDYGIFTNLSPDHVSPGEHQNFQEYLECKRELFRHCRVGIINGDDPYAEAVTQGHSCRLETYGFGEENSLRASEYCPVEISGRLGVRFRVTGEMDLEACIPMPGRFSAYNALAAICLCRHFHVRETDIQRALLSAKVKGRMESVANGEGWHVYVDYAHNPMALASLLETLREYHPKRLVCLFGCGGDRPVMRRRMMGRISGEKANLTIVTDDNPRSEDPAVIRQQIAEGVRESGGEYVEIAGRREAISYALSNAREGDLIILAGKGHETCQEIGGEKIPLDERKIIGEILSKS